MHDPVDANVSFPVLEERILEWWRNHQIPRKALGQHEGRNEFVFYEGPPTANAKPGLHFVVPRVLKDIYNRFHHMKGFHVPRKAGWDCHGLPVELEVEKRLGFTNKGQIEEYGVERFNQLCRESVTEYVGDFTALTERIAFWVDFDDAYWTMSDDYIESVWWSLAELHKRGLLYEGDKITPYCPRCETPLSDHEVAQGYQEVQDPSVTLAFPLQGEPVVGGRPLHGAALAVWTTTPWTLISNMAAAVHPEVEYALAQRDGRRYVLARNLVERVLGEGATVEVTFPGRDLVGVRYRPPLPFAGHALQNDPDAQANAWRVVPAEFVTTSDGTGVVHIAPAFGADDLEVSQTAGIPTFNPVDSRGRFDERVEPFAGRFVKDADADIIDLLRGQEILIASETYTHSYPHCWRCGTPLLYYAKTSWYVRTTQLRERLLEVNENTNWIPEHIRDGRYGNWLENNVDWSLSRYRFWGTPLPVWRCPQGHDTPVESRAELSKRTGRDLSALDLHRPFVDEVEFACPDCAQPAHRVPDLIDVWYDSGAMPFAQYGYPHQGADLFRQRFPADFICEAIDQTRGWFYSLMAEGVLLFDSPTYRNVVCHGHLVDAEGRKMSKSLGNVLDPWEVMGRYGSDAVRFYVFTSGPQGSQKRISYDLLDQVVRGPLLTLWNVYRLYVLYANVDGFDPKSWAPVAPQLRPSIDRWVLSELHQTIAEVDEALEAYDCTRAGRRIGEFIDDLSNWYVRRSRRRFWRQAASGDEKADKSAAYWTLWTCLSDLARLLAPFTPFLAEELYRNLVAKMNPKAPESVHLASFPKADGSLIDPGLAEGMAVARSLVSLGRSARTDAKVKVRQPLARAVLLVPPEFQQDAEDLSDLIAEELNVREVVFAEEAAELVKITLRPNYRTAGPDFGPQVKALADALADAPFAADVAETLESGQQVELDIGEGETLRVGLEHVEIRREPAEGTAFAYEAPFGVSLDLEVDEDLRLEGIARELVHQLQNLRKQSGLDVTDRVRLAVTGADEILAALREYEDYVREEVLIEALDVGAEGDRTIAVDGVEARVRLERA